MSRGGSALTTDSEGKVTLGIEGGKTAVISNLPHGATFRVEQPADRMPAGFSQGSAEGAEGTIIGGKESQVRLSNNYSGAAPSPSDQPAPSPSEQPAPSPSEQPAPSPSASPTKPVPRTGDSAATLPWLGILLLGLMGISILTIVKYGKK